MASKSHCVSDSSGVKTIAIVALTTGQTWQPRSPAGRTPRDLFRKWYASVSVSESGDANVTVCWYFCTFFAPAFFQG